MTLEHSDPWLDIHLGDVRDVLPTLPADSVDCIVTSPPYWGLRDYGTASWSGGDAECDHLVGPPASSSNTLNGGKGWTPTAYGIPHKGNCGKCGAIRQDSQLGLERTPEEYVANMVGVFRELRRVLKPSGTCWLNLGDSYAGGNGLGRNDADRNFTGGGGNHAGSGNPGKQGAHDRQTGLKPKDLVGIPWRVAFALQADGWYLRSDIIWAKPNPMPESVTDRPTKSHEYLFLLTKSARYYFDADAVREPEKPWNGGRINAPKLGPERINGAGAAGTNSKTFDVVKGANLRSVWTIATRPYPGAHFAVFPPELPERCIKAGSSERGVCPECGAPWERVIEKGEPYPVRGEYLGPIENGAKLDGRAGFHGAGKGAMVRTSLGWSFLKRDNITSGWRPSCQHETLKSVPAVILDPFAGSGTVGMVANQLSRRAVLVDLNADYLRQQMQRNLQVPLGLTEGDRA